MTLQDRAVFAPTILGPTMCEEWLLTVETKSTGFFGFCVLVWVFFFVCELHSFWCSTDTVLTELEVCVVTEWLLSHELLCLMEQWTCILGPFSLVSSYMLFLVERVTAVTMHGAVRFVKHTSVEVQFSPLSHGEVLKVGWNFFVVGRDAGPGWYFGGKSFNSGIDKHWCKKW